MGNLKKSTGNLMTEKKRGGSHKSQIKITWKKKRKKRRRINQGQGLKQTYMGRGFAEMRIFTDGCTDG